MRYGGILRSNNPKDDGHAVSWTPGMSSESVTQCSVGGGPRGQSTIQPQNMLGMQAGITGLTGSTDQQWVDCAPLDHDPAGEVVINVRLVVSNEAKVRPMQPAGQVVARANPVPAPVG